MTFLWRHCIHLGIRQGFPVSRMTIPLKFAIIRVLPFQINQKDLDPSYKMDLDFWDSFGWKKTTPSYNSMRKNILKLSSEPTIFGVQYP